MAPWLAAWLKQRVITLIARKLRERREKKVFGKVLKGKLTYTALGGLFAAIVSQMLGDGVITQVDWQELGQAAVVLLAVFGRWRATRGE